MRSASRALLHVPEAPARLAPASGAASQCKHSGLSQGTAGPSSLLSKHQHQPRHCTPSSASTTTDTLKKMLSLGYRSNPAARRRRRAHTQPALTHGSDHAGCSSGRRRPNSISPFQLFPHIKDPSA